MHTRAERRKLLDTLWRPSVLVFSCSVISALVKTQNPKFWLMFLEFLILKYFNFQLHWNWATFFSFFCVWFKTQLFAGLEKNPLQLLLSISFGTENLEGFGVLQRRVYDGFSSIGCSWSFTHRWLEHIHRWDIFVYVWCIFHLTSVWFFLFPLYVGVVRLYFELGFLSHVLVDSVELYPVT